MLTVLLVRDPWAWVWALVIVPLVICATGAALSVTMSGLVGIIQTSFASRRLSRREEAAAEQHALSLLKDGITRTRTQA